MALYGTSRQSLVADRRSEMRSIEDPSPINHLTDDNDRTVQVRYSYKYWYCTSTCTRYSTCTCTGTYDDDDASAIHQIRMGRCQPVSTIVNLTKPDRRFMLPAVPLFSV